jgi:hypothetical protein
MDLYLNRHPESQDINNHEHIQNNISSFYDTISDMYLIPLHDMKGQNYEPLTKLLINKE